MRNSNPLRGRNFLMTPGPSNVPDRVLAAMHRPAVDLVDSDFMAVTDSCFADLARVFRTDSRVFVYASNGHGAWEAALANLIGEGDLVLVPFTGVFSAAWGALARDLGAEVEKVAGDWRRAFDPDRIEERLRADRDHRIKAVLAVHTDTATSVTSDIAAVRRALDACRHPALLMADVVASLGTVDFRMDDWGVDVAVAGSQKGLMTPPGLAFTAVSPRALERSRATGIRRGYWDWPRRVDSEEFYMKFFGTPPEHLIWALREALDMLFEEGLETAFARHRRLADAVHAAVGVWGETGALELNAVAPAERATSVTTIRVAKGIDSNRLRILAREELDVSLGYGLGPLDGKAFRIGHMGWINEPMVLGALGGVEMAMQACGVPYRKGGVTAAVDTLAAARFPEASRANAA
ncbi:MAG: aminotransferase class V-fold PLP-dependent enzyme [Thiotrichales bacterium]|nr:aminotransferase class V-fold PLP-dependent enzyme [Thiotrichales bacterium]